MSWAPQADGGAAAADNTAPPQPLRLVVGPASAAAPPDGKPMKIKIVLKPKPEQALKIVLNKPSPDAPVAQAHAKSRVQAPTHPATNTAPLPRGNGRQLQRMCEAIFAYNAAALDQLSLVQGEVFTIIDDSGAWWRLRNASGREGMAPSNYLAKKVVQNRVTSSSAQPAATTAATAGREATSAASAVARSTGSLGSATQVIY